jgi:hypothetical protein
MKTETIQTKQTNPEIASTETQAAKPPVLWILGVIAFLVIVFYLAR